MVNIEERHLNKEKEQFERIAISGRFHVCGVSLFIMDFFKTVGYIRPLEYDTSFFRKCLYHIRTLASVCFHLGKRESLNFISIVY